MPEDGDDILQVLVALQDALHLQRNAVVLSADDVGVKQPGRGGQRIHRRVQALLGNGAFQRDGGIQVPEDRHGRGVRVVVSGDIDGLHRGDGPFLRRGDPFLESPDVLRERGLVADGGRHAAEKRRDLASRLGEAEHVVDEQEHVHALLVAEELGHREGRQPHAQPVAREARSSGRRRARSCPGPSTPPSPATGRFPRGISPPLRRTPSTRGARWQCCG